jgi:hypothetical protein
VTNALFGTPIGFVTVSVTRAPPGNPLSCSRNVEPRAPVFAGKIATFAPVAGGAGGFVRGAAVGAAVGAPGAPEAGVVGAALTGAAVPARTEAAGDAAGSAVGVISVVAVAASQPTRASARIASATKRGCITGSVGMGPGVPARGTFAEHMKAARQPALDRVRAHCLALPDVTERPSHGTPAFFVGKKMFVQYWIDHHADGREALWCAAPAGMQVMRVRADPARFFVPAYVGHRGWLGVRLDRRLAWAEVAGVIEDAYAVIAPRRSVAKAGL